MYPMLRIFTLTHRDTQGCDYNPSRLFLKYPFSLRREASGLTDVSPKMAMDKGNLILSASSRVSVSYKVEVL